MKTLKKPVLVLNKSWIAIRVRNVKQAIKLLCSDRALVVDPEDYSVYSWEEWIQLTVDEDNCVHGPHISIKIPEVIILSKYNKVPEYNVKLSRRNIFLRDKSICQYSGIKVDEKTGDIDHIVPKSKGGKTSWDNLVVCSKKINRKKGNKLNDDLGLKLIKQPKRPDSFSLMFDPRINAPDSWKKFI